VTSTVGINREQHPLPHELGNKSNSSLAEGAPHMGRFICSRRLCTRN